MVQICNLEYRYQFIMPPILLPRIFMLIGGKEREAGRRHDLETKGQRASPGGSPGPALQRADTEIERQSAKAGRSGSSQNTRISGRSEGAHGGSRSKDSFIPNFTHHMNVFVGIHANQLNPLLVINMAL